MKRFGISAILSIAVVLLMQAVQAADPAPQSPQTGITGTMDIAFNTRMQSNQDDSGNPKKDVQDMYRLSLVVNGTNKFEGTIARQGRIKQFKIRTIQQPRYDYRINISVGNHGVVGQWVGPMTVDEKSGAFQLGGDENRALRIIVDKGQSFTAIFDGVFYGKAEDKSKLSWESITRTINGKQVEKKYQSDPIRFDGTRLAKGPNPSKYPDTFVSGSLDYDRETANYYAKNLTFRSSTSDKPDVVTGSIKWVEDANRKANGKGRYEFNLRFNEEANKPKQSDDQAFAGKSDDDLFFAVDNAIPTLQGTIDYIDQMQGDSVTSSKVEYHLVGNKLSEQQVMEFAKMWLLSVGPTNDE